MTKFVSIVTTNDNPAFINSDHIRAFEAQKSMQGTTIIHFIDGNSITINELASTFADRLNRR